MTFLRSAPRLAALLLLLLLAAPRVAGSAAPEEVVARATGELTVRSPYEDGRLPDLVHRALREATGADVSLAPPLPAGTSLPEGAVSSAAVLGLVRDDRVVCPELTGETIHRLLERTASRFATYRYEDGPLLEAGAEDSLLDVFEGLEYEIDLTRPAGRRVTGIAYQGRPLDPDRKVLVATTGRRLARLVRGDSLAVGPGKTGEFGRLSEALLRTVRERGLESGPFERSWSLLPDYATTPERPLVDRLVRLGAAPPAEVRQLHPDRTALRGDVAYWLARSFDWRARKLSGAFGDVPDSLEPWLDGLLQRDILGEEGSGEYFRPFAPIRLPLVLEWIENAARRAAYALATEPDRQAFRRSLFTGTSLDGGRAAHDTVTRVQALAMLANARFPVLRILETTDFHGAMLPRSDRNGRVLGGSANLAGHVSRLRAENPEGTLLLDGGDAFQGTMISNLASGRPVVEQMNRMGYAAMAIGNHEFDWSADTLIRRIYEMRFPALAANLVDASTGKRPRWARSDTLLVRRGVRIGLLGLAYPRTPSVTLPRNVRKFRFLDDSSTAARIVPVLRKRGGAEVVIGLGHIPGIQDSAGRVQGNLRRLGAGVRGVDLWAGGHSHTRVAGEVAGVPVMLPGSHGELIGVADLVVDPVRDRVVEHRLRLHPTWASEAEPDSSLLAVVERWNARVAELAAVKVGTNLRRLGRVRAGESAIGSLVADVIRDASGAEIALQNNGGLRADLPEGAVTRSSLFEVVPFDNEIVTLDLTGAEVRRVLEEGLRAERAVQVSGIRYRFDLGREPGSRVTSLTGRSGEPLDEARTYRVAANDFMAEGGDDLATLTRGRNVEYTGIQVRDMLEEFVRRRCASGEPLDYRADGRVAREPGSRPPLRD